MTSSQHCSFGLFKIHPKGVFYLTDISYPMINLRPVLPGHVLVCQKCVVQRFNYLNPAEGGPFHSLPRSMLHLSCFTPSTTSLAGGCGNKKPLVKICGVVSPRDAEAAAEAGADFVGMIMSPGSKRSVSLNTAKQISKVAMEHGAKPVGVFVDDDINTICRASTVANLELVQLHGEGSRRYFREISRDNRIIYVLHVSEDGILLNTISEENSSYADWILVDSSKGGSGKGFKWNKFKVPLIRSVNGWLLAGGIHSGNVCEAVNTLKPNGVDVSSGVSSFNGVSKDHLKIAHFITTIRSLPPFS